MGLAANEENKTERAIEFYKLLSSFDYMSSTPTLFNSGTHRPQLSSCYLTTVPDDLSGIYGAIRDNALLSKWAGGLEMIGQMYVLLDQESKEQTERAKE